MLEFSRNNEKDPLLNTARPDTDEVQAAGDFRKWVERAFQGITLNVNFTQLDNWFTRPAKQDSLNTNILYDLQTRCGLGGTNSGPDANTVQGYEWLRHQAVGAAAERVALAQRTFLWSLEWLNAADHIDLYCKAHGAFPNGHPIETLHSELNRARPILADLIATNSDSARMDHSTLARQERLEERISAAQMLLGALLCFEGCWVPNDRKPDLPEDLPPRELSGCLGGGTGWLLTQLHADAYGLANGLLLGWESDALAKHWVIADNGHLDSALPEGVKKSVSDLGLTGICDAEGIEECVATHAQMVKHATSHPDHTLAAWCVERSMMQLLNILFDVAINSQATRHGATDKPDELPRPEDPLKEKCELMGRHWSYSHDPEPPKQNNEKR